MRCLQSSAPARVLYSLVRSPHSSSRQLSARHTPADALSKAGWETIIGLEIHAQLKTREKLFSDARTSWEEPVNTNVALLDAAFPGTLPRLNREAVAVAVKTALALKCTVSPRSTFDRKHYFYHDIPASYQITQHYNPLATAGRLTVLPRTPAARAFDVGIHQIQLEQDTAKTSRVRRADGDEVVVDLNRAGVGLIEIVTEPDMRSPEEAATFIRALQAILRRLGASDGDMEKGSLRVDANVSVHRAGEAWGTRCEIKNLNSVRFMQAALEYERHRHVQFLDAHPGQQVRQETRGFDEARGGTFTLRTKEDAQDYRYMPDPNIPPVAIMPGYLDALEKTLPELPDAARQRLTARYGISAVDVDTLLGMDDVGGAGVRYFERVVDTAGAGAGSGKKAANWIAHELLGQLAAREMAWTPDLLPAGDLAQLILMIDEKVLTGTSAKALLKALLDRDAADPPTVEALVEQLGLRSPEIDLAAVCKAVIAALPKEAESVRKGNERVVMRLVGQVMKDSGGAADAKQARAILLDMLKS